MNRKQYCWQVQKVTLAGPKSHTRAKISHWSVIMTHICVTRPQWVNDPIMQHGVTHVPWCMSGSLTLGGRGNVPSIPGACATRNFTHLARGRWTWWRHCLMHHLRRFTIGRLQLNLALKYHGNGSLSVYWLPPWPYAWNWKFGFASACRW